MLIAPAGPSIISKIRLNNCNDLPSLVKDFLAGSTDRSSIKHIPRIPRYEVSFLIYDFIQQIQVIVEPGMTFVLGCSYRKSACCEVVSLPSVAVVMLDSGNFESKIAVYG